MTTTSILPAPLRVSTYSDGDSVRHFQWVISELEDDQIRLWDTSVNGAADVMTTNTIAPSSVLMMEFTVTTAPTAANASLNCITNSLSNSGVVQLSSDSNSFTFTKEDWLNNGFFVFKDGVKLVKGVDVLFTADGILTFVAAIAGGSVLTVIYASGE